MCRILIQFDIKAAQKYLLSRLNDLKPGSLRCQCTVCSSTTDNVRYNHSPVLPANKIVRKMTSQLWADFNKVWFPPFLCICIFANTGPFFYSHLPRQIRAEGRASTVRAPLLQACRWDWWQKEGRKSLFFTSRNHVAFDRAVRVRKRIENYC